MSYDLKTSELPLAGYGLVLRSPTLRQHKAVLGAFEKISVANILATLQPAIEAAKSSADGSVVSALVSALPATLTALRNELLGNGMDAVFDAAAICLDTRANHRRLSGKPVDEDYDAAVVEDFERGQDGASYLECPSLRAWVRANIGVDAAFWTLMEAVALGGYGNMGKLMVSAVKSGLQTAAVAAPTAPATRATPITA